MMSLYTIVIDYDMIKRVVTCLIQNGYVIHTFDYVEVATTNDIGPASAGSRFNRTN
jgi:hypothetical protein